jgi:predicted phosphoribosyltransferase
VQYELFRDRRHAGRLIAAQLGAYAGRDHVIVLALPRGGVPVAFEIARALHVPLDVFTVRKLGVPGHEELGFGAIATGGVRVIDDMRAAVRALRALRPARIVVAVPTGAPTTCDILRMQIPSSVPGCRSASTPCLRRGLAL